MTIVSPEPPVVRAVRDRASGDLPMLLAGLPAPARQFSLNAWERRGPIAWFVGTVAVASVVVSLLLPKWYAAECTILPPAEGGDNFDLMSAIVENKTLNRLGLFSSTTPSDIYLEIMKSRTLREPLAREFDLQRLYSCKGMEATLTELDQHVRLTLSPIGVVTVRVEDRDPQRAAAMANHLVRGLDRFNRESVNTRAKRTREFLEQRLLNSKASMARAESTLTAYEQKHKIVASSEGAAIGAMAEIISQKLNLEVRRSYLSGYSRPGSAPLRQIDAEIEAMDHELGKLPILKQEGSRIALDAEIQRRVFMLLSAQYEDMRVQETRDTPTLTVLDTAQPPERRSRPRRAVIVLVSTMVAIALAAAWVVLPRRAPVRG